MNLQKKKRIVLLGLMTKMPFGGNVWLVMQCLIGLQRLGYDPYYVEAHGCPACKFSEGPGDQGLEKASAFIARVMKRFDLGDKWAYHAVYEGDQCFGMTKSQLNCLYDSASAIINLHGGTELLPEHCRCPVRVYLGTDPVDVEVKLHQGEQKYFDLLEPHTAFYTWGLNYGAPDCGVPVSAEFHLKPVCPPVIVDWWASDAGPSRPCFTTVGNYRQGKRNGLMLDGERYQWSKHFEFLKFIELPKRSGASFELALSRNSYTPEDRQKLESHGWRVRDALEFSTDPDEYRRYLQESRAEFTVAKDQNVRLKSGWFSERSAAYLAAGRPVVTQDTGFQRALPGGEGLFGFNTMDEALGAVDTIESDYDKHSRAATELARNCLNYDVVLPQILASIGA